MKDEHVPGPLATVLTRYRRPPQPEASIRGRGRPLKRTPEYLRALLASHRTVAGWYLQTYGRPACSDRELYTAYFADLFLAQGERASRASTADFQRSLKTLRNELAEARRLDRANPGN